MYELDAKWSGLTSPMNIWHAEREKCDEVMKQIIYQGLQHFSDRFGESPSVRFDFEDAYLSFPVANHYIFKISMGYDSCNGETSQHNNIKCIMEAYNPNIFKSWTDDGNDYYAYCADH